MKTLNQITMLLFITSFYNLSYGQYYKKEKTSRTIVQQRSVYLNGGLRASADGKSRIVIPFDLPKNTIEWYYSFSTSAGTSGTNNLNLAIQMSSYLVDQSGTTAAFLSQVKVPSGSSSIDAYLLNSENQTAFVEKWDNDGGTFYFIAEGTVKNTKQAVVKVDDVLTGRWYLGLKNPSTLDGVNIIVEIIAVVESEVYVDEWTSESMSNLKSNCIKSFLTESSGKVQVCDCLVEKITSKYLPSEWNNMSKNSQAINESSEKDNCYTSTNNLELKKNELAEQERIKKEQEDLEASMTNVYEILKQADAAKTMGDYADARNKLLIAADLIVKDKKLKDTFGNFQLAELYNSIAWYSILINDLEVAGESLKKGLTYNSENMYLRGNLGNYHLLKGNYSEAEKAYLYYKRKQKLPSGKRWVNVIAEDLKLLESKGMGNPDFDKIRIVLKIK